MVGRLILAFIFVPLVDLVVLLRIGRELGFWPTLAVVILTGVVGATLARWQGLQTLTGIQASLSAGNIPTTQLADGALILLAAALLLTPGFLTDLAGLLLLIPPARAVFRRLLGRHFKARVEMFHVQGVDLESPFEDRDEVGFGGGPRRPMKYVKNEAAGRD